MPERQEWTERNTLGDIADTLRDMKIGGMTRESIIYALDRVFYEESPSVQDALESMRREEHLNGRR